MGGLKFADVPAGCFASLEALPTAGWLQIMLTTCMMETGYFLFEYEGYPNVGEKAPGDIGGESWVRYDDADTKAFPGPGCNEGASLSCCPDVLGGWPGRCCTPHHFLS